MTSSTQSENIASEKVDFCNLCGVLANDKKLSLVTIESKVGPTKKVMLCGICSGIQKLSLLCVSERKKTKEDEGFVTELQVSRRKESRFREYVYEKISESENLEFEEQDLINSAAEEIGISPITARRYLDKICSSAGILNRYDNGNNTFVRFAATRGDFE